MSRHATFLIVHSDPLKRHHAHWKVELKQSQNCDQCWRSCGFFPPVQHWLAGGGGGGMGEEGESHMGSSQAAVTWFMFAGWADWRRRSSGEKFVQEETWSLLSCGPLNKLKSSSHQTACHGNPCHQSKGEFSVCLTTMLNVLFVQCLTKTGV